MFAIFLGMYPVVAPEGGLALPRVKPGVPQCLCASEPPRVWKVPKKQVERTPLLYREIISASTNDVQIAWNSKDRSDVAAVCSKHW